MKQRRLGLAHALGDGAITDRLPRLAFERVDLARELVDHVFEPREVVLRRAQPQLRLVPPRMQARYAGGFLEHAPALFRLGLDDLADAPLMHHRGRTRAGRSGGEQDVHVAGAHLAAVDAVGGARLALDAARHVERLILIELGGRLARAVVDLDRDLGIVAPRPAVGAGKDHVVHVGGAQRFVRGLAHHPAQRFDQVRFAAAVRPDHAGEPRLNQKIGRLDERFETEQTQPREFHRDAVPVLTARRRPHSVRPRAHGRVERWVEGRRIDRHNESPGAIPQQKERVIPPALAGRRTARAARMTGLLQQEGKWLKKRYQPLR